MIKVLLADDHKIVRSGIKHIIDGVDGISVVNEVSSGEEVIDYIRHNELDVVLMDLQMPGMGGLEATRKIVKQNPQVKVIILTVCDDDIFPMRLLKSGASGYLTKGCESEELIQAIKQVVTGKRYLTPELAQQLALKRFDNETSSPFENLSERELQVMLMITKGQKVPYIAEKLHLSTKTVNTYRYRIFEKLSINSDVELTHLALRYGVIDNPTMTDAPPEND